MSVYEGEQAVHLDQSLASLAKSTIAVPEVVLVEDGPLRHELRAVIDRHRQRLPIVSVCLAENVGLPRALNAGLTQCSHEYVARLDSDDLIIPHRFQSQLDLLEHRPDVCAVSSTVEEFDPTSGRVTGYRVLPSGSDALRQFAKMRTPLNHPSVMFRRSVVLAVGGYRNHLYLEDYALWVRCLVNGHSLANIREPLVRMRAGLAQMTRRRGTAYMWSEVRLAGEFRRLGFLTMRETLQFLALRLPARILPPTLLRAVYRRHLRTEPSE